MFNRKKLFSSVKKDLFREFPLETKNHPVKIVILLVNVLHGSVVAQLRCGGYILHCSIRRSVRIKQL